MTISEAARPPGGRRWIDRLPLFVLTAWIGAIIMLVPGAHALAIGAHEIAAAFLFNGALFAALVTIFGLASLSMPRGNPARGMLLSLVATFAVLPAMLAVPMLEVMPALSRHNAYLEMVSAITTTGFTVFDVPDRVAPTIHLWRALVGWYGGFVVWVAAIAVLAPLRLGGFEVVLTSTDVGRDNTLGRSAVAQRPILRIFRFARVLAPVYLGLTLMAWLGLLVAGETPLVAACHAMSALATSGISPLRDLGNSAAGRWGEVVLAVVLVFALSRSLFARDVPTPISRRWYHDPELRFAAALLVATPAVILGHHWISSLDVAQRLPAAAAWRSLWGSAFTSLSFLTTGGFISGDWTVARNWSGLMTPGLILLGLAMVGGGIATTAGGVKLMRVYVLYKRGLFEIARLVQPSIIASPGHPSRRFRIESAYVAWLYFMLFALTLAAVLLALSLVRLTLEESLILATAALTTTGPLALVAAESPIAVGLLDPVAQAILCAAMVLGRLETLALVALLNPEFWRG